MDTLVSETAEEVFGNGITVGLTFMGHALLETDVGKVLVASMGGVLDISIGVENKAGARIEVGGHSEG